MGNPLAEFLGGWNEAVTGFFGGYCDAVRSLVGSDGSAPQSDERDENKDAPETSETTPPTLDLSALVDAPMFATHGKDHCTQCACKVTRFDKFCGRHGHRL